MLPTSLALAWPLWRRHRWGLTLSLGYLSCVVIVVAALPLASLGPITVTKILTPLVMPLIAVPTYLMTVFSFGNDVDVNMPESCFPRSLFQTAGADPRFVWLACGVRGSWRPSSLWFITAWFILGPWLALWDLTVPLWWPAMLVRGHASLVPGGALVTRGLAGHPYFPHCCDRARSDLGGPVLRDRWATRGNGCARIISFAAVTGWLVGYFGIRKGRRGDVPDWTSHSNWLRHLAFWRLRRREPFANAAQCPGVVRVAPHRLGTARDDRLGAAGSPCCRLFSVRTMPYPPGAPCWAPSACPCCWQGLPARP